VLLSVASPPLFGPRLYPLADTLFLAPPASFSCSAVDRFDTYRQRFSLLTRTYADSLNKRLAFFFSFPFFPYVPLIVSALSPSAITALFIELLGSAVE